MTTAKILYYVDCKGAVWKDIESGPCPRLIRMIKSLWRDYNIFHVEAALKQAPDSIEKDYVCRAAAKKCGITSDQYSSLVSITKLLDTGNDQDVDFIPFLESIKENKGFNKNIRTLMNKTKGLSTISQKLLEDVSAFSHKIKREDEIIRVAAKANTVFEKYQNSIILNNDEKLTLKEVKMLESSSKMKPFLDQIAKYRDLSGSSIDPLYKAVVNSHDFIERTLSIAEKEDPSKPGTFIVYDQATLSDFRSIPISLLAIRIFRNVLRTNIEHISVGVRDENGQDLEAHMWGDSVSKFVLSRRSLGNRCFKTIRLLPQLLVDETKMIRLYGNDWEKELGRIYEKISLDYFKTNPELKKLYNPKFRRIMAAIGYRFSFYKQSWEERCRFPKNNRVICSEFAILSSLQCLKKLNERIKEQWDVSYPGEEAPKLNPPVRENRRLNRVIPHEIVARSLGEQFAIEISQAYCIKSMIQCNETTLMF